MTKKNVWPLKRDWSAVVRNKKVQRKVKLCSRLFRFCFFHLTNAKMIVKYFGIVYAERIIGLHVKMVHGPIFSVHYITSSNVNVTVMGGGGGSFARSYHCPGATIVAGKKVKN